MPKVKDARADKAFEMYKQGLKLVEIANQLGVAEGTVRSWKNRYKWAGDNATLQRSKRNVAKNSKTLIKNKESPVAHEVESVMKNTELTDKQQLFCIYYIRCFNATKAYQKAYGCNYTTAMSEGSKHLRNPKIKEEIFRLKQERLNREFLSESDIFQKYMDIAFADITDYVELAKTSQIIKLFMSPEIEIKPGAKITVTQAGVTETYECSGTPAVYETHQEIILKLAGRYA